MTCSSLRSGPFISRTPFTRSATGSDAICCHGGCGVAVICLGVAQVATDTLLELAASKVQVGPFLPGLRDRPAVQAMVAPRRRSWTQPGWRCMSAGDLWAACSDGTPVSDAQRGRVWESGLHAAQTAKAVVTSMYEAAARLHFMLTVPSSGRTKTSMRPCSM